MPAATFPSIEPTEVQLNLIAPTQISRSISGRETRNQIGGTYYELTYGFENLDADDRRRISGHIANAKGPLQSFYVKLPTSLDDATGAASGTISVNANAAAGDTSVDYSKLSAANETVFKAGDMIQFSNHGKIYEVTTDSVSTTTTGTVDFYPPLKTAVTTSHTINYQNLEVLVRYKEDIGYEVRNNLFADISIGFVEVVE